MPKIQLMPYHVRVRRKGDPGSYLQLGHLPAGVTLFQLLEEYLHTRVDTPMQDTDSQRILSAVHVATNAPVLSGIFRTGDYGYEADIVDANTFDVSYRRTVDDAQLTPFYFQAYLPDDAEQGFLLLQKFGVLSPKTTFRNDWFSFIAEQPFFEDEPLVLEINPILSPDWAERWVRDGRVTSITLVRTELSADLVEYVTGQNLPVPEIREAQLRIQLQRNEGFGNAWKDKFLEAMNGGSTVRELFEVPSFEPDTARLTVVVDGSERVIDVSDESRVRTYFNITDQVEQGDDGHPTFDSINGLASAIRQQLIQG
jgi:hypothetical protein